MKTLKKMFINLMLVLFTMTIFMPITLFARTRTINTINSENELHMSIDSLGFLDWDDVDGATGYVVELTQPNVTSLNSWETTESIIPLISYIDQLKYSSGQYTIIVSAKGVSSDASMSYYYTSNVDQLEAPNGLIWDGNIARWNAVSGASVYNVELLNYDGRVTLQSTNNTSFDFSGFSPEDGWTFKVQAKPEASGTLSAIRDSSFIESPKKGTSERKIKTINSGNSLHMSIDSLGFLEWDDVDGATGYVVGLTQPNITALNSWETTESIIPLISYIDQLKYSSGQYIIIVSAKGVSSDESMSYYYTSNVDQLEAPNGLIWDGDTARWNAVSGASVYNVELLNYDGRVTLQSTNNTSFDFSGFSPEDGWTFKVQAKPEASGTLSAKRDSLFIESPAYEEVAKYTVTYDANGGSGLMEIENLTVENDGFAKNYTFPECEFTAPSGKEFDKWQWYYNSNPSSTNETTPGNNPWISGNITVKALWKEITTYIVTYDANGGSGTMEIENLTVENDGFAKNYTFPECGFTAPSGKEFDKWQWYYNSDPSATYETTPGNNPWISGNITVKALWKDITYTVTFNSNGGSAVTTQTVVAGGKAIRPDDPTKENRTFGLWYKDEDLTEQFSFENETITKDTILYAKWKVSVFVHTYNETTDEQDTDIPGTFKIPEFGVDGHNNAFQCTEGQEYTIKATPKTGYRFVEWRSGKKDGDTVSKDVEYTFTAPIITLYAVFEADIYTVTFESNGGSAVTPQTVDAGGKAIRPDDPTKENRTFGLWYKDEDLTEQFSFENETITKDTILYAKWKVSVFVHTYNETTDEQDTDIPGTFKIPEFGVDGHNNAFQCTEGQEYKIKATPKTGYRFVEWRSGKKDGDTVSKDVEYTFTAPIITLYAVFEAEQVQPATYTVTFNSNGGSAVATIENVTSGEKISKPTDPTRTGYTFAGWYKESELTNEFNFATDTITSDTTLYAKWEEVVPATITTISVGNVDMPEVGESSDDLTNTPATLTYGDSYQMAGFGIKVKNGDSWDDYNGEENVIEAGKTYRVEITLEATSEKLFDSEITDANITVNGEAGKLVEFYNNYQMVKISKEFSYAAPATYTVTFNSNGGSAVATIENVTSGEKISKPTDPTRTGYTFAGWYKESELTNEFNFATDTITSDTTLFAKWNKKQTTGGGGGGSATTKYTITVKQNDNGKISPETTKVEKGDNQKFEIKADKGYEVEKVLVDGKSVGAVTEYTFEKVKEKHTIEATFKKVEEVTEETWKNPFTDVTEDDWFYEAVKYANENKLFNGVSSTEFGPNVSMTRAMLVTVLYRLEGEPATNRSIPFADVDMSMYYANAVIWAKQNNIVNGVDETNFAPNLEVTREQLVTVLYRYAQYKGKDVSVGENTNILSYDDFSELSEYAIPAMQWACGSGIITGRTISTIAPKGTATRAEVATMLMRFTK